MYLRLIIISLICISFSACKDDTVIPIENNNDINGITACLYAPYTNCSTFNYAIDNGDSIQHYTITAHETTSRNGKQYVIVNNTLANNNSTYYNCENDIYTAIALAPTASGRTTLTYLKTNIAIGSTWENSFTQTIQAPESQIIYRLTLEDIEPTRIVNDMTFNQVYRVFQQTYNSINGNETLTDENTYWYAEGVGFIEHFGTNGTTKIISFDIN